MREAVKEYTQSSVSPGNCWQTAVACILEIDPAELPDQVAIETTTPGLFMNAINAYLEQHHGLMYSEVYDYQFGALLVRDPGWHLLDGPTVRTPTNGSEHVIVGRNGEPVWDPHPSRAGLTTVKRWGILAPLLDRLREEREKLRTGENAARWQSLFCACPRCRP